MGARSTAGRCHCEHATHEPCARASRGDLTVTVEAGALLGDLNRTLAAHGQWLPLDPFFGDRATIGGLLATNDSGPHRHRFGTPRDLVIGVRLATVDGRLAKAGGQVVKNVAGYDLSKLVSGSFGGLAAIVSATFKLSPAPPASGTVLIGPLDSGTVARIAAVMASSQLEPVASTFTRSGTNVRAWRHRACCGSLPSPTPSTRRWLALVPVWTRSRRPFAS